MTTSTHEPKQEAEVAEHPAWCGQQAVECLGGHHRSVEIGVELDEHAGCEVRARLWGGTWDGEERIYIDLDFISEGALDQAKAVWARLEAAATAPDGSEAGTTGGQQEYQTRAEAVRALVYGEGHEDEDSGDEQDAPAGESEAKRVVRMNPLDPVYVSDPHGHSLTVEQAEILGGVLGYLVRAARGGDTEALRAGAKLL